MEHARFKKTLQVTHRVRLPVMQALCNMPDIFLQDLNLEMAENKSRII